MITTAPATGASGTINLINGDGYTYALSYVFPTLPAPTSDITFAKPGQTVVGIGPPLNGSMTLANTTSGRQAPVPFLDAAFGLLYESSRPACNVELSYGVRGTGANKSYSGRHIAGKEYCLILLTLSVDGPDGLNLYRLNVGERVVLSRDPRMN